MDSQPLLLESPAPAVGKHKKRFFTDEERNRARSRYESSNLTLRQVANELGASYSSLLKWSMDGKWRKPAQLVLESAGGIESLVNSRAAALVDDKLAPFIEEHRVKITKRAVKMAEQGLKRLETLWKSAKPVSTRFEADGARALETFIRTGRTSLGMDNNDNSGKGLSVELLAGSGSQLRIRQQGNR